MKKPIWADEWTNLLTQHSYEEAITFLNQQVGENRKTPNAQVKSQAITIARDALQPVEIYDMACTLTHLDHPTARELAAYLFLDVYDQDPKKVLEKLYILADDVDWEVREWVASACGDKLIANFDSFYPQMANWTTSDSPNVRRAAALAAKYACKIKNPDWADSLLDLVETLLTDSDSYVKKNLGPFTIGDAMLRTYPDKTMERLEKWIQLDNVHARWNLAKIFTTAQGAKMAHLGLPVLKILLNDDRPIVKQAVKSAMTNLRKRCPEVIEELQKETGQYV